MITPRDFVGRLAEPHMPNVFNPWCDVCPVYDREDAPQRRRQNLEQFLTSALDQKADTLWIARDLGYRGGRRTGLPMTDEAHFGAASSLLGGAVFERATEGSLVTERTAAVIWGMLARIRMPVILWNVFPFHPHEAGNALSNRCHTRKEREATRAILEELIELVQPRHIVAIGRDSQGALEELGIPASCVRHPSYGGQTEFVSGVCSIYGIKQQDQEPSLQLPFATA